MKWKPLEWLGLKKASPGDGQRLPVAPSSQNGIYGWNWGGWSSRNQKIDFRRESGDPLGNSAVAACVNWMVTNWPQAVPTLYVPSKQNGSGKAEWEPTAHRIADLMRRPCPFYDGKQLLQAVMQDYFGAQRRGNAYIYIVVVNGEPVELQHLPTDTIMPVGDEKALITGYEYRPQGELVKTIPPEYIIHWRNGFDPVNPRLGRDPLYSIYPEIATDNRATIWQHSLLKRGGVPAWLMGPKEADGVVATLTEEDAAYMKQGVNNAVNGDEPGGGVVVPAGFQFEKMGFDPKSMVMGENQRKGEERISAVIGMPPVVAGLGAGLDRSTFSNYEQAEKSAWTNCIVPNQDSFIGEVGAKLLPWYGDVDKGAYLGYDRSGIKCLQEDESAKATDSSKLFVAGIIDRASAKRRVGEKPEKEDEGVYKSSAAPADPNAPDPDKPKPATDPKAGKQGRPFETKDLGPNVLSMDQAVRQYRQALQGREDRAVTQMRGAVMIAEQRILNDLEALLEKMQQAAADGEEINEYWLEQEARFRSLLSQIDAVFLNLGNDAAPKLADAQADASREALRRTEDLAAAALGPGPEGVSVSWNDLPVAALESFVGFAGDGSPLADLIAAIGPDTRQAVREALIAGIAAGDNPRDAARAMRRGAQAKLDLSRARAETIARTEMLRAAREASRLSYEDNSDVVTGYQRVCAGDSRTCAACFALHGSEYQNSQIMPTHPNCRCVMVPRTKSWAEITGDDSIPDTRPDIASADALFARLSAEQQREVLGEGGFAAWNNGAPLSAFGVVGMDARWGPTVRVATLGELGQ